MLGEMILSVEIERKTFSEKSGFFEDNGIKSWTRGESHGSQGCRKSDGLEGLTSPQKGSAKKIAGRKIFRLTWRKRTVVFTIFDL